jgi:hypothetical protein
MILALSLPATAIKQKELVKILQEFFGVLPPVSLPDINFKQLNLYANASNVVLKNLDLNDLALTIPDSTHVRLDLQGMTAELDMTLLAGITGPIPIHRTDSVTGTVSQMTLDITFLANNGDGKINALKVDIGKLKVDFGSDTLANMLSQVFTPVLVLNLEHVLPTVLIALYGNELTFDHLITSFLNLLPKSTFPSLALTEGGYDMVVDQIKLSSASAQAQKFQISGQQMIFEIDNLVAQGSLYYKIGKIGQEAVKGKAAMKIFNANLLTTVAIQHDGEGLELVYVSATQQIQNLVLSTDSPDPLVSWFIQAMTPMVKSLLENGFSFLMNLILSI